MQPQINTVEDIYKSPFRILTSDEFWERRTTNILESLFDQGHWDDKVVQVDLEELNSQIDSYNTSISFMSKRPSAKMLLDVQKRLNIRGYHISQLQIQKFVASYPVNPDFPFVERLNEIIHWIRNAGLYEKWLQDELSRTALNYYKKCEHLKNRDETDIQTFPVPFFIFYGWFAGIIVLIIEIIWKNFKLPWILKKGQRSEKLIC